MSRTNPTEEISYVKNPAVATIEWNAQNGEFSIWDSVKKEKNILKESFKIAVLDQLASVEGWMNERGSAMSTEFRYGSEVVKVFLYKDGNSSLHKEGTYSDIKESLKEEGITYRKVIYAMLLTDLECDVPLGSIVKIKLKGKSANLWIENKYSDNSNLETNGNQQIGRFKYPVWNNIELDKDEIENAEDADKELQDYFNQSLNSTYDVNSNSKDGVTAKEFVDSEDIPF